jgi:anti-sigma-K factor RskA
VKNCDQFREMHEAYALGALDPAERSALEAHLTAGCEYCAKAVEEARWLVSQLAYMAPEAAPSEMLKRRLIETVRSEAQSYKKRSTPSRGPIPFWMWAGLAALLLFSIYSAWNTQRLEREIRSTNLQATVIMQERHDLEVQLQLAMRAATIVTDPASVKISLASREPQLPPFEAKWHSQLGIVLTGQNIPLPSGNRVLQLWLIPNVPGGKPIPSLALRPDADGKFVLLVVNPPELMAATKALAITEEPEGGSPQPTTAPRWVGGIR